MKVDENITAGMRYDIVKGLNAKYMFEALPELKNIKAFYQYLEKGKANIDFKKQVIAFIVLLYSKDSILNVEPIPRFEERQLKAAEIVGFQKNAAGEFKIEVKDKLFGLDSEAYSQMAFEFVVRQNDMLWDQIMLEETMRLRMTKELFSNDYDDKAKDRAQTYTKQSAIRGEIDKLIKSLQEKYKELFQDNEQLIEVGRQEMLMTSLEKLAE